MTVSAERLLSDTAGDAAGRLRWVVLRRLGVCPLSLRGRLLSRRGALRLACQMVLDARTVRGGTAAVGGNPNFDEARFRRLAEGGEVSDAQI